MTEFYDEYTALEHDADPKHLERIGQEIFNILALDNSDGSPSPYPFTPAECIVWQDMGVMADDDPALPSMIRMFIGMRKSTIEKTDLQI